MKEIYLTQGKIALVDNDDYDRINAKKWFYRNGYAARNGKKVNGVRSKSYSMQSILIECPKNSVIDHINHNKLDNRKSNLRICSERENLINRRISKNNKTGYKGVSLFRKKYKAQISSNGKFHYLGVFCSEVEAARAYNEAAIELHGEFAVLNGL